jgi:lauroyl/myristoyl acyltransferase
MNCENKLTSPFFSWLDQFISQPPELHEHYSAADFSEFMRKETYLFSPRYAKKYVIIHGQDRLLQAVAHSGVILTPVHYGSFFLSGGAVVQQLKLPYTAIVTGRNIMPTEEQKLFWNGVHLRSSKLYQQPLLYTGTASPQSILKYLSKRGNLLGVMLDVREQGQKPKEYVFNFFGNQIYLNTGPARLAFLANVPIIPMTIQFDSLARRHHLYFSEPVLPCKDHFQVTQQVLSAIECSIAEQPEQWFFDMPNIFSFPHDPNVT